MLIIFIDTLKQIKKPRIWITLTVFSILIFISNIVIPNAFYPISDNGHDTNSLQTFIHFQYSFISTALVLGLSFLATWMIDIQETTFIFTRNTKRNNWIFGKTFAQLCILSLLTLISIFSWVILDVLYHDKVDGGIFGGGFSIYGLCITYLVIMLSTVPFINALKWVNKDWIATSILPFTIILLIMPYTFYIHIHMHMQQGKDDVAKYIELNTFIIPVSVFGCLFFISGFLFYFLTNKIKVKI